MEKLDPTVAQRITQTLSDFEQRRTGRLPKSVTVVLNANTLVIALHGALSPAEKALASSRAGAAEVQEFHRQLFNSSSDSLRQAIQEVVGVELREANVELGFEVGADIPVHRWQARERIPTSGQPSEVAEESERPVRTRLNRKGRRVYEQRRALEEKRSAVSNLGKEKRKVKGNVLHAERIMQMTRNTQVRKGARE